MGIIPHHCPHQHVGICRDPHGSPAHPAAAAAWISSRLATLALRPASRPMNASRLPGGWAARTSIAAGRRCDSLIGAVRPLAGRRSDRGVPATPLASTQPGACRLLGSGPWRVVVCGAIYCACFGLGRARDLYQLGAWLDC
jgi:hypothetical protein